jgi:hypothetical protein
MYRFLDTDAGCTAVFIDQRLDYTEVMTGGLRAFNGLGVSDHLIDSPF